MSKPMMRYASCSLHSHWHNKWAIRPASSPSTPRADGAKNAKEREKRAKKGIDRGREVWYINGASSRGGAAQKETGKKVDEKGKKVVDKRFETW